MFVTDSGITRFVTNELFRYNLCAYERGFEYGDVNEILHHAAISLTLMLTSLLQPENALLPMLVTPPPIVTFVRLLQLWNAAVPMLVTLSGIVKSTRPLHL